MLKLLKTVKCLLGGAGSGGDVLLTINPGLTNTHTRDAGKKCPLVINNRWLVCYRRTYGRSGHSLKSILACYNQGSLVKSFGQ